MGHSGTQCLIITHTQHTHTHAHIIHFAFCWQIKKQKCCSCWLCTPKIHKKGLREMGIITRQEALYHTTWILLPLWPFLYQSYCCTGQPTDFSLHVLPRHCTEQIPDLSYFHHQRSVSASSFLPWQWNTCSDNDVIIIQWVEYEWALLLSLGKWKGGVGRAIRKMKCSTGALLFSLRSGGIMYWSGLSACHSLFRPLSLHICIYVWRLPRIKVEYPGEKKKWAREKEWCFKI